MTVSDSMSLGKQFTAPPTAVVEPMKSVVAGSRPCVALLNIIAMTSATKSKEPWAILSFSSKVQR